MVPYPQEEIVHWTEHSVFCDRLAHATTQEVIFIKGYCLRCNEGDYEHCRCFPTNQRDLNFGNEDPPIEIYLGNCDNCYSCGTLGYECLACSRLVVSLVFLQNTAHVEPQQLDFYVSCLVLEGQRLARGEDEE